MKYKLIIFYFISIGAPIMGQKKLPVVNRMMPNAIYFENGDSLRLNKDEQHLFFIFHAEEDSIGLDPGLSIDGRWRAIHLKKILEQLRPLKCYTTPFRRDVLSLQPLTDALKTDVNYYDQSGLNVLFESLKNDFPVNCIIVVHKQTISLIFEALTKKPFLENLEQEPADRLFYIHRKKNEAGTLHQWNYRIR